MNEPGVGVWPGAAVLTTIGRSNVTLNVLVVPSVIRLPLAASPPGTDVLNTCGPGTISGSVFGFNPNGG